MSTTLSSVVVLSEGPVVVACFHGSSDIRVAASVAAEEFSKDFTMDDILQLREAIGITGVEDDVENRLKAAMKFANELLFPALADVQRCSVHVVNEDDCRIAVVEVRYAIAGLGFMKGRLKLDRVVRQGEVIAAIAAETASLQNDVRQMKREEASRTSEYTHLRANPSTPVRTPMSKRSPSSTYNKKRHSMSVVNPNRRLMNSRKRIKGLDFDDDNDDSDKPKSPSYNIPSLSRKLEDSPHFNVHGYEHSTKDLPEESTAHDMPSRTIEDDGWELLKARWCQSRSPK